MNRTDLKALEAILDKRANFPAGPSVRFMLEALVTETKLMLDARDVTAGKLVEITIERGDDKSEIVLARPVGEHFAIHKDDADGWMVTHRASGLSASRQRKGAGIAAAIATALQRVKGIDWSKAEPLTGASVADLQTCTALACSVSLACIADAERQEATA